MKKIFFILLLVIIPQCVTDIFALCTTPGLQDAVFSKNDPIRVGKSYIVPDKLKQLASAVEDNLYHNIIPFWLNHSVDSIHGGFFGMVDNQGNGNTEASKGLILNARILWTFSSMYMHDKDEQYLFMADRAYQYIDAHFIDKKYGGGFYMVDKNGNCFSDLKYSYANAFLIYGLAQYHRAAGSQIALEQAEKTFLCLENYAHDAEHGGYGELFQRDWSPVEAGTKNDIGNAEKTMNTSLHLMEAFANLYIVWKSPLLAERLREMITITLEKIINPHTHRQYYFFNRDWTSTANVESYGHDIESSWLLLEAAEILGDGILIERVKKASVAMAESTLKALQPDGRIIYESVDGKPSTNLQWWAQAEAIVGFVNAWELTGDEVWLSRALSVWDFTDMNFVDKEQGEWFWGMANDGKIAKNAAKVSAWKCPYHNSRMCLEVLHRLKKHVIN